MEPGYALELVRKTLITAVTVASPLLAAVLVIALVLAILQTVLNLQEQTLTVVPKILTAVAVTIVMGPWALQTLIDFATVLMRDVLPQRT